MKTPLIAAASAALLVAVMPGTVAVAQDATTMTFFITSQGSGEGANLGGVEGADALCQRLADAAGSTGKTWHAYLSAEGINAKDRIGTGPWQNFAGVVVATDVASLHSDANNITKETGLTETGAKVNGRGDDPNQHDMLTGSNADGTLAAGQTCSDWTSSGEGTAMLGHHDRMGPDTLATATSWNAAHPSRGCGQEALISTGGNGLFYCFAVLP
ncbi:MAG TPA: hypothetical protein VG757_14790 [Devosia sp.]|nr:hypothetical protein [Devosia sp.]